MSFWQKTLIVLAVLGAILLGALFALQQYLSQPVDIGSSGSPYATSTAPAGTPAGTSLSIPENIPVTATSTARVVVPPKAAGEAFYVAINAVYGSQLQIDAVNNRLVLLLQQMQARTAQMNFSGIFSLLKDARDLIHTGTGYAADLSTHLDALAASESSIVDPALVAQTGLLITTYREYLSVLSAYFTALSPLVDGSHYPTKQNLSDFQAAFDALKKTSADIQVQGQRVFDILRADAQTI